MVRVFITDLKTKRVSEIRYRRSQWSEWRDSNPRPLGPEWLSEDTKGHFRPFRPLSAARPILFAGLSSAVSAPTFPLSSQICGQYSSSTFSGIAFFSAITCGLSKTNPQ